MIEFDLMPAIAFSLSTASLSAAMALALFRSNKPLYLGCCVRLHFACFPFDPIHQGAGIVKPTNWACIKIIY